VANDILAVGQSALCTSA